MMMMSEEEEVFFWKVSCGIGRRKHLFDDEV